MPRFSIKDLMLATTLVAIGLAIEFALMRWDGRAIADMPILAKLIFALVAFGTGGALIGAGALTPFHKKAMGAGIGFALGGAFLVVNAFMGI